MNLDKKIVNNIRVLASEVISNAKSGHTGIVLSSAPILYTLYAKHLKFSSKDPSNILRDKFVLSAGHGSALLYSILHLFGYNISKEDLMNFRKLNSITSGHPELNSNIGVECTTGPLGQGVATAVGMAISSKTLERFNQRDCKLFDNKIYTLIGDGCLMEGVCYEALSLAGTLKLDNLIVLYDSNNNTLDSTTAGTFSIDIKKYVESLGFKYLFVKDGNNVDLIDKAISKAKVSNKPTFIEVKTILGYASKYAGQNTAHGLVMDDMQIEDLRRSLGVFSNKFEVEDVVKKELEKIKEKQDYTNEFKSKLDIYKTKYPKQYKELKQSVSNDITPIKFKEIKLDKEKESTRNLGGIALNTLAQNNKYIIGGNADLSSCTKAYLEKYENISREKFDGNNVFYGVREFAMACIANGISLSGLKTFAGTFMVFSDYMRSAIRSSALMNIPVVYILSHDSIAVGEDGPTHQPIEHLDSYRIIPNLNIFRPCNLQETIVSYNLAFSSKNTPSIISLTRQPIKMIDTKNEEIEHIQKGGYIFSKEDSKLRITLLATGSEVPLAMEVKQKLGNLSKNIRVVSIPCVELFENQPIEYKREIIPDNSSIFAIEAGTGIFLQKYVRNNGKLFNISDFGKSAPMQDVFECFSFTSDKIVEQILAQIER